MEGSSAAGARQPFRLDCYLIDPQRNRVTGPGGETALQPKVIDVLCVLSERHGEVLSRDKLIDQVWGKEFGADESLTRAISQLRKVFDDTRGEPRIIETISKRGYRLIARPVAVGSKQRRSGRRMALLIAALAVAVAALIGLALVTSQPTGNEPPPIRSERTGIVVTVEPFSSNDPALPVRGLGDELSAEIARSPLIRARSGSAPQPSGPSALQYRLRGAVHRVGERLRIGAQLIDAASGEVVWSGTYDRPHDRHFSTRDSIVAAISADSMLPVLTAAKNRLSRKPATSLAPWEAVLLVTWVPGDEGRPAGPPHEDSYWLQRHALGIDPDYAPAHALFAELAAYHALFDPPYDAAQKLARARAHANRAIELAPYDAEVLYQLGLYYRFSGDRDRAQAMLGRVIDLQPNHPLARIELDFVRGQCAADPGPQIASLTARIQEFPRSSPARWVALSHLSSIYLAQGDFERARDAALESRRIIPMTWTAMTLAAADAAIGRKAEAASVIAEHRREWPNMDLSYFAERVAPRWCLGGPRTPDAQAIFRKLADAVPQPGK
ncbi:MAG: winged helix-turn-helix domain-containing protein [Pseudomonadota bacterium]|nr:winged helix-turn-helix domain-containing protein [Pseudomonadota bacterium]